MNLKLINIFWVFLLILPLAFAIESDKTYVFRIQKNGFYVNPVSLELFDSPFSEKSNLNYGAYRADLVSDNGRLYSIKFDLYSLRMTNPTKECFENSSHPSCKEDLYVYDDSYVDVLLNFPYFKEANAITVYYEDKFLFKFSFEDKTQNIFLKYKYYFIGLGIILFFFIIIFLFNIKRNKINPRSY